MKSFRPISSMKLWDSAELAQSAAESSPDIDLREVSQNARFSVQYLLGGAGHVLVEHFAAPVKGGTYTEGAADVVEIEGGGAQVASVSRAVASNVATIETGAAHNLAAGEFAVVRDMEDSSYNGIHKVVSAPDATHFTFALTHADEVEIADDGGRVVEVKCGSVSFTPVAAMPWLKITVTEQGDGSIDYLSVWLNIQ